MELGSILQFLEGRSILVTGATGFIAKIFIEKILRVQPHINKLYLLLRASDTNSAMLRFNNEIVGKELFNVLKEKSGGGFSFSFSRLISEKTRVVAGDITLHNLGVKDSALLEEMFNQIDVVVNLAATTNFDDRYDVSLELNTLGPMHVLNFSKKCKKLKILVHVSTAFVSGAREGLILERPHKMGEALNGAGGLDINEEKRLVDETLKHLTAHHHTQDFIKSAMKDLGMKRAKKFGWTNTYTFTKAMGEMMLGEFRQHIPLVIIRPTIVTSTYKEPFPGWVEGLRTVDSLIAGYGKGRIACFLGDPKGIHDVIPADMVVNAMVVAMVAHANQANETIYHVGSSVSNPMESKLLIDCGLLYFTAHPWIDKNGKPVIVGKVTFFDMMEKFQAYMMIRYFLPLKGLQALNTICCQYFKRYYQEQSRKIEFVMRLIDLYEPYLFFNGFFDDMNTENLRRAAKESGVETETEMFYFDPKIINWEDYFINSHIPGLMKWAF